MRSIVVDTGPLAALLSRNDRCHGRGRDFLRESRSALLTTWPVLTEAWHLLAPLNRLHLMRWVAGDGCAGGGVAALTQALCARREARKKVERALVAGPFFLLGAGRAVSAGGIALLSNAIPCMRGTVNGVRPHSSKHFHCSCPCCAFPAPLR